MFTEVGGVLLVNMTPEEYGLEVAKAAAECASKESVNKLSNAIGNIFPFLGLKHQAVKIYVDEIKESNLSPEAKMIAIADTKKTYKQLKNQTRIAQIAKNIAKEGTDFSQKSIVDEEWLERFMDSAKFVSDEEVQLLWGNVLASEFENPNSTPPSVIRILSEITPKYAKAFQILCSLGVNIASVTKDGRTSLEYKIIIPYKYDYLNDEGIDFSTLNELEMLGLIRFDQVIGFVSQFDNTLFPKLYLIYGDQTATVINYDNKQLPVGCVILTRAGESIARFTDRIIIKGHFDAVCEFWKKHGVELAATSEIQVEYAKV